MKEILIQDHIKTGLPSPFEEKRQTEGSGTTFFETLKGAIGDVNKLQQEADQAILELSSGENRDIHNTMIAMEKAGISFQLMMQVRNKIISAYETIMRMNI
jgi:flagellar hook-basal body complex protein FliE